MLANLHQAMVTAQSLVVVRMMQDRWLSPEILEWQPIFAGGWSPSEDLRSRSYEILAHAEQVLGRTTTELARVDVIASLRRAIDRRLRALNGLYSLKSIPIADKPPDSLRLLEFLGIIRSQMLQKLIDIRNAVEHEDVAPPDLETCKVFAEFTWYFLKSTDRMLQEVASSFELLPTGNDEEYYWLIVEYGPDNQWRPKIRGWIKPEMILKDSKSEWLSL